MRFVRHKGSAERYREGNHRVWYAPKLAEREKAIELRGKGYTYTEILKEVPVARSTLSLWLRSEKLSKRQIQRISEKKRAAMLRGSEARRRNRIERTHKIKIQSLAEVKRFIKDPLFLLGTALYWAEGSKQKEWNKSQLVAFSNMDPLTHKIFIDWVERYQNLNRNDLKYELYIHEFTNVSVAKHYWKTQLDVSTPRFGIYFKRNNPLSVRHNKGKEYHGVLRIIVPRSTDFNRQIAGWIEGVLQFVTR